MKPPPSDEHFVSYENSMIRMKYVCVLSYLTITYRLIYPKHSIYFHEDISEPIVDGRYFEKHSEVSLANVSTL